MALEFQTVPVNFGLGLDGKTDSKMSLEGKLSTLENGVFTKAKRLQKRNGYTKLGESIIGGASSIGVSDALAAFKPAPGIEELVQVGSNKLYSYSPDQSKWVEKDSVFSLGLKYKSIYRNQNDTLNADAATNSGLDLFAWYDSTNSRTGATVIDSNTGTQITLEENLAGSIGRPRCAAIGNYLYLFYVKTAGGVVWRRVDISSPQTFSAETTVGTASTSVPALDVVVADGYIWVAFFNNAGTNIEIYKLDSSGAVSTSTSFAETVAASGAFTLRVNSNVFIYWYDGTNGLCYRVRDSSLASVLGRTVIDSDITDVYFPATAIDSSSTSQTIYYSRCPSPGTSSADLSKARLYSAVVGTAGVTTASAVLVRSIRPASKAFTVGSYSYLWCIHMSDLQSTLFLIRSDGVCVGKAYEGRSRGAGRHSLPTVVSRSSTEYFHPQAVITKYDGVLGSSIKSGIACVTIDFNDDNRFQKAMLGGNLHFTGGYLSHYDGRTVVEHGFHLFPEGITYVAGTSGGSMADGVYEYSVVYEWVDNMGQVHRSAPSVAIQATVSGGAGSGKVTLTIPTLRVTEKRGVSGEVAIQIYRTEASGTVFYNVKGPAGATLFNDTTADSVTYEDTAADGTINTNEILYTTGGVLENIAPPSCRLIDVADNRMVISGMEDPLEVQYSKRQVEGEGVGFSDAFTFRVQPMGGDISAVKIMDDKIIIFKDNTMFFVSGDGPSDTGQGNSYTTPQLITSDSGCPYPKSCVLMPLGIMYKSRKGIYLLNRALQVEYIGADVEDFNSQTITSAHLIQDKNQVRFLTSSGSTLVYDYFFKQWSTFTNHTGVDSVSWLSTYCYLRTDGKVYQENTGFLDDTTGIVMKAATAWMKFAGIQGYQRIRRIGFLGDYKSAHQMQIRVGYDYKTSYTTTYTFDATTAIASTSVPYEFRVHLAVQKCASMRFEFSDVLPGSPGESYNVSDLSLEVGLKKGVNKLASAKSI